MQDTKDYDATLRMFREVPGPVNVTRLRFLRWLAEHDRLEHPPAGPPTGEFADAPGMRPRLRDTPNAL